MARNLEIDTIGPPPSAVNEARATAIEGVATQVTVTPSSNGWHVLVEGLNDSSTENPDTAHEKLTQTEFDNFVERVKEFAQSRKHITPNFAPAGDPDAWEITVSYDGRFA